LPVQIPKPLSYPQQLGEMIDAVTSRLGVRRLPVGGGLLSILEAAAQADVKQSQNVFNALLATDLDSVDGALDRIGEGEGIPRYRVAKATGRVTISDTSFVKKSSKIYQGLSAPIIGSLSANVEDTTGWPSSGGVYLGRGTANIEGPLTYSSITDFGAYKRLNLTGPTTRFHNRGESCIVSQGGDRAVGPGTLIATQQGSLSSATNFVTTFSVILLDGETELSAVDVVCTVSGVIGNISAGLIREFAASPPFVGATVSNPSPFISGRDVETHNNYRQRIREVRSSKQRGTDLSIKNAIIGAVSADENKRVASASLVRNSDRPSYVYIDDGSGYEGISDGVGIETIENSATGGEERFQTLNRPVEKATVKSSNTAPFDIVDGAPLSVSVGGVTSVHFFKESRFKSISAASSYEVVSSINSDPLLKWSAHTSDGGKHVSIFAKSETNDDIQVVDLVGLDANDSLLFSTTKKYTTLLYKNDRLLSKDGNVASYSSRLFSVWNSMSGSQTLTIAVDQTPSVTYTFTNQDFIDANTGYTTVGKNSLAAWALVINRKVPGVTASIEFSYLTLTSNLGRNTNSKIYISGGTLVSNSMFLVGTSAGQSNDYFLDRGTGQIFTNQSLEANDSLTLGTTWTRGFLETPSIPVTTVATDIQAWFLVDADPYFVPHGVGAGTLMTADVVRITNSSNHIRMTANTADAFKNVSPGDWMVLSETTNLPSTLRNAWRVVECNLLDRVVVEKRQMRAARIDGAAVALAPAVAKQSKILITGGYTRSGDTSSVWIHYGKSPTGECEIFDPNVDALTVNSTTWTTTGPMITPRAHHTASLLPDGKVLVVGGYNLNGALLASSEIWDPTTNLWTAGPVLAVARAEHSATVLTSGRVLIAGGVSVFPTATTNTAVEYNQATNTFINPTTMVAARAAHGATRIQAGTEIDKVFVTGGADSTFGGGVLDTTEMYNPAAPAWVARAPMTTIRAYHGAASVSTATGKVLVAGGEFASSYTKFQLYNPTANTWATEGTIETGFYFEDKRNGLIKPSVNNVAIAYGGFYHDGISTGVIRHKKFDGSTETWSTIATGFYNSGVERASIMGIALTGTPASPNANNVWFGGGISKQGAGAGGGFSLAVATGEMWVDTSSAWSVPDDTRHLTSLPLPNKGITFVRSLNEIHKAVIPAAINYTAPTFITQLNAQIEGTTSSIFQTSKIRIETNSYDDEGDISLVSSTNLTALPIEVGTQGNLTGHLASVESSRGIGTPHDFKVINNMGKAASAHTADAQETYHFPSSSALGFSPPASTSIVFGLKRLTGGRNPYWWQTAFTAGTDPRVREYGNTRSTVVTVAAIEPQSTSRLVVGLRETLQAELGATAPVVFAAPFAIGPRDNLTAVINRDLTSGRFPIQMWRRLKPAGVVYGSQVELSDYDGGTVPLARSFGIEYDFNDFAVYMKARAKSHSADAAKSTLWRFYRHGPDGNSAVVRFTYPALPDATVDVTTEQLQTSVTNDLAGVQKVFANIVLGSGPAKTGSAINATSNVAVARCNQTAGVWDVYVVSGFSVVEVERSSIGGTTRLRIQMPNNGVVANGPQSTGLVAGNVLWFEASNPAPTTLFSGSFAISSVGAFNAGTGQQDIIIPAGVLNDNTSAYTLTATPGTLSYDSTGETAWDGTVAVGDLCRLDSGYFPAAYVNNTMRIASLGRQHLRCRSLDLTAAGAQTSLVWTQLIDTSDISLFGAPTGAVSAIVASVNALQTSTGKSPISGTVIGTGLGVIDRATWDELNDKVASYNLTDGVNYVQRTIDPLLITDNTQFLLKDAIAAGLQTDSDWINEDVRISPVTVANVVNWLQTPAISGLFSVAEVADSDDGNRVQIASLYPGSLGSVEIQGGLANNTTAAIFGSGALIPRAGNQASFYNTVKRGETDGLIGGRWVAIDNLNTLVKTSFWNSGTTAAVDSTGLWTFSANPFVVVKTLDECRVEIEKVGNFVAIRIPLASNTFSVPTLPAQAKEGDFIYLTAPVLNRSDLLPIALANKGVFRIVRATENETEITIWIENPTAIEEISICKIKTLDKSSTIPGDTWQVSTPLFGSANRQTWKVSEVGTSTVGGEQFSTAVIRVDTSQKAPAIVSPALAFGTDTGLVQLREGLPARFFKKIICVTPNGTDSEYADVQFDSEFGYTLSSASAGSVITALDKLQFPGGINEGNDGYRYSTGLIGEANRIIYGDPNSSSYQGYGSNGAQILVSGPLVKRVSVALAIRAKTGLVSSDLTNQVKSATASVINKSPVGVSISLSDIIAAVADIQGVVAVSIVSPTFSSSSDVIEVGPSEKPLVVNFDSDILVSFVGE